MRLLGEENDLRRRFVASKRDVAVLIDIDGVLCRPSLLAPRS